MTTLVQAPARFSSVEGRTVEGVLLALVGAALFTPIFAMGKLIDGAAPVLVIVAMRYAGGVLTMAGAIWATRTPLHRLRSQNPLMHLVRAALCVAGGLCAVQAAFLAPVAEATAIGLTEALLIVLFAALFLGERVCAARWAAAGVSALGAAIVLAPTLIAQGGDALSDRRALGAAFALLGAILIALETLLIKVIVRKESGLTVLAYVNGWGALIMIPIGIAAAISAGTSLMLMAGLMLVGPLAIIAQYCNILAYRRADASVLGPVSYAWILFASALGYVAFGEVPGVETAFGGALIVLGGVWLAQTASRPRRASRG